MTGYSIGVRLTVWYSLVLLAGMALLGVVLWFALRQSLLVSLDEDLGQVCRGAVTVVEEEGREKSGIQEIRRQLQEYAVSMPPGRLIEVYRPDGERLFPVGPVQSIEDDHRTMKLSAKVEGQSYTVVASTSLAGVRGLLRHFGAVLLWATPFILFTASFGGYWISRRALAPVDEMTAAARSIGIRNLSQRLAIPRTGDELQRLSETWNEMLSRLEAAVRRLTQFTADASHELRTPVALIRTTAELSLRRERGIEEYREALMEIKTESECTSKLVDDLLALARADTGQMLSPIEPIDLVPLVYDVCQQGGLLAETKGLSVQTNLPQQPVMAEGNAPALRRLLLILLDNAVKYSFPGGTIHVSLDANPSAVLTVTDKGMGMPDNVLPHIFERFYRADPARTRDGGGSGLGLAIAKWIADVHRAEITVQSQEGQGSVFRVNFSTTASC